MVKMASLSLMLISLMLCALSSQGADVPATASQIDAELLAFRQSIRSGIVQFELSRGNRVSKHRVEFSEEAFRGDNTLPNAELGGMFRQSLVFPAQTDIVMFYSDEQFAEGGTLVGSKRKATESYQLMAPPDPRVLGLVAAPFKALPHSTLSNTVFADPECERSSPTTDRVDGRDCLFVSYTRRNGTVDVWFDPQRSMNPVRMVGRFGSVEETTTCELQEVSGVGWFPARVRYSRMSGGQVSNVEDVRVNVIQLNKPVDSATFTWAGMGVPDGHPINDDTADSGPRRMVMRDGVLVDRDSSFLDGTAAPSYARDTTRSIRWAYLLAGTIGAVLALWFLWKKRG